MADDRSIDPASLDAESSPALDSLDARIDAARQAEEARLARERGPEGNPGMSAGWQIGSTMLGYPLGGIIIGWVLDGLFGTRPWIMIVLMFAAFAGACLQIVRSGKLRAQ